MRIVLRDQEETGRLILRFIMGLAILVQKGERLALWLQDKS